MSTPARLQPFTAEIKIFGGIFVKPMFCADAGMEIPQHAHEYDHLSLVAVGAVMAWADGVSLGIFSAPASIEIKAGIKHRFRTMAPGTLIYCIHNVRDALDAAPVLDRHDIFDAHTAGGA